jgi:hypothetical protein
MSATKTARISVERESEGIWCSSMNEVAEMILKYYWECEIRFEYRDDYGDFFLDSCDQAGQYGMPDKQWS